MSAIAKPWDYKMRVLSPPMKFVWAGFHGNSMEMQAQGWEFAVERSDYDLAFVVIMRHKEYDVYGITPNISMKTMMDHNSINSQPLGPFHVRLAHKIMVTERTFTPVSMRSEIVNMHEHLQVAKPFSIDGFFTKHEGARPEKQFIIPQEALEQAMRMLEQLQTTPEERAMQNLNRRRLDIPSNVDTGKYIEKMVQRGDIPTRAIAEIRVPKIN